MLAIRGGRGTQPGYLAVIAFCPALWLFGWIETVWVLVMLPAMLLLPRAEFCAIPAFHRSSTAGTGSGLAGEVRRRPW